MGEKHEHQHSHGWHFQGLSQRALTGALVITLGFMVVELLVGWWANSLALMTDAAHMLTDAGALGLSLFALWMAKKPANYRMTFGYQRAEILGALANGLAIWFLAGIFIYEALMRFGSPPAVQGKWVFFTALLGLLVNILSMRFLHSAKEHSLNVKGAYLHVLSDLLGSIGAITAGGLIWLTGWNLADPLMSIIFALLVLYSSWHLVRDSLGVLMESVPKDVDAQAVEQALAQVPHVEEIHDLHIWMVASGQNALSVHLLSKYPRQALLDANQVLKDRFGIRHTTIQVEDPAEFKSEHCYDCQ